MKKIIFTFTLALALTSNAQIIVTLAGDSTRGYTGDGGKATNAELNLGGGVAVDIAGNMYIADAYNNRIRMVNSTGIITTIVGGSTQGFFGDDAQATDAQLNNPYGVAI